jgi:hypothetical protein
MTQPGRNELLALLVLAGLRGAVVSRLPVRKECTNEFKYAGSRRFRTRPQPASGG